MGDVRPAPLRLSLLSREGPPAARLCAPGPSPSLLPDAAQTAGYNLLISTRVYIWLPACLFAERFGYQPRQGGGLHRTLKAGEEGPGAGGQGWGQAEMCPLGSVLCKRAPRLPACRKHDVRFSPSRSLSQWAGMNLFPPAVCSGELGGFREEPSVQRAFENMN